MQSYLLYHDFLFQQGVLCMLETELGVIYTSFFGIISGGQSFFFFFHVFQLTFHAVCLSLGCDDPMLGLQGSARRARGTSPGWLIAALMRDTFIHTHSHSCSCKHNTETLHTCASASYMHLFSTQSNVDAFLSAIDGSYKKFTLYSIIFFFCELFCYSKCTFFYKLKKTWISKCTQCNLKQQEAH